MESATATTLSSFLSDVGTVLTSAVSWLGTIVGAVMNNPVLLVPTVMGIAMAGVALFKSLKD